MITKHLRLSLLGLFLGAVAILPANALIVSNNQLQTTDNESVFAVFVGSSAAFADILFETNPSPTLLFNENTSTFGDTIALGTFAAGTELRFALDVFENSNHYATWLTGN